MEQSSESPTLSALEYLIKHLLLFVREDTKSPTDSNESRACSLTRLRWSSGAHRPRVGLLIILFGMSIVRKRIFPPIIPAGALGDKSREPHP